MEQDAHWGDLESLGHLHQLAGLSVGVFLGCDFKQLCFKQPQTGKAIVGCAEPLLREVSR